MGDVSDAEDPPDLIEVNEENASATVLSSKEPNRVPITLITGIDTGLQIGRPY